MKKVYITLVICSLIIQANIEAKKVSLSTNELTEEIKTLENVSLSIHGVYQSIARKQMELVSQMENQP